MHINTNIRNIVRISFLTFLYILLSENIYSQIENIPLIEVSGESAIKVLPDYCILGLRIEKNIPTNSRGEVVGFEIFKDEDTRLSLFDFNDNDITETIIQVNNHKLVKEIFITVRDLNKLDKWLLNLAKQDFSKYVFIDYRINDYEEIKNKARRNAIKSAKEKARILANELGQTIGKAHTVQELEFQSYNMYNFENYTNLEDITYTIGADEYLIEPGYITISAKIRVSFDLNK